MKILSGFLYLLILVIVGIISAMGGKYFAWGGEPNEYEKYGFQVASVAGSWFSAFATLVAVIAAIYTVFVQIQESKRLADEERLASKLYSSAACFAHSMSVINQLRSRLTLIQLTLIDGGRPAYTLPANASKLSAIFEQLLDKENFNYLPGSIVDAINNLSGSIFGVEMLVQGVFLSYTENPAQMLPARPDLSGLSSTFETTDEELNSLFTMYVEARNEIDELIIKSNLKE